MDECGRRDDVNPTMTPPGVEQFKVAQSREHCVPMRRGRESDDDAPGR